MGLGGGGKVSPRLPIVLVEGILDGDDGVLGDHGVVLSSELLSGEPLGGVGVGVLEVEIAEERKRREKERSATKDRATSKPILLVRRMRWNCYSLLSLLVELRGGNIESDGDLSGVTSLLDGDDEEIERLGGSRDVGGESSLISDVGG